MPQFKLPQTPVKQKSRNMLHRRQAIGTGFDIEDHPCDISPTLKTKKGRASLGSGCLVLDPKTIVASPLMTKRRDSKKLELNPDSDEERGPFASSDLFANDGNPGSAIKGTSDLSSSLDEFFEPVPFLSQIAQSKGEKKDEKASTSASAALFGVDFNSPAVSPSKLVNPAERFVIIVDSPLAAKSERTTRVN